MLAVVPKIAAALGVLGMLSVAVLLVFTPEGAGSFMPSSVGDAGTLC